jgi:hypothetical protein
MNGKAAQALHSPKDIHTPNTLRGHERENTKEHVLLETVSAKKLTPFQSADV